METITLLDNSVMKIYQEGDTWCIDWVKDDDFEITIRGLTRKGVDEYIETVSQDMENYYELKE